VLRGPKKPMQFAHLPALSDGGKSGAGGRKAGSLAVRALRNDGVEPAAIAASLAGIERDDGEMLPLAALADRFGLADLATCRFDVRRMLAVNRRMLAEMDFASVADRLPGGATEAFWLAIRGHLDMLKEARGWWDVVAGTIVPPVIEGVRGLLLDAEGLLPAEPWDSTVWATWIRTLEESTGLTGESLTTPLRLALTGEDTGPDLADLLPLIGRPSTSSRLLIAAA
jgi:glutamyl-tRNA synthetase